MPRTQKPSINHSAAVIIITIIIIQIAFYQCIKKMTHSEGVLERSIKMLFIQITKEEKPLLCQKQKSLSLRHGEAKKKNASDIGEV